MFFKDKGILGINARNLLYIKPYNKKKAIKLADDKIKTKQFLSTRGVPVPKLYNTIQTPEELERFDFSTLPNQFVIKPNNGYGGEGIIPIINKKEGYWMTAGGKQLSKKELKEHISDIIDGRFSISNVADIAFFEQLIIPDEAIGKYSYEGLPDIRIVVHNLIPVMAMLRLPTKESSGKANLHLGAVGVGIDIAKGELTYISYKNKIIDELPNNLGKIRGVKIPYWDDILLIASQVQLITNLGYMAIDICLDKNNGPVLLEINARAGLGVQIANLAPLRKRLERIQGVIVTSPTKGVRVAKDMFGNVVEKEIAHVSGKLVIATEEKIEIIQKNEVYEITGKIDTGRSRTVIDKATAEKLKLLDDPDEYDQEKSTLKIKFILKGKRIQTIADVVVEPSESYKVIIGTRDLKNFLIDTSAKTDDKQTWQKETPQVVNKKEEKKPNYKDIDEKLNKIDSKIKLLYHLRPLNLEIERKRFFKDPTYNPQFEYPSLKFDPIELVDALEKIKVDESPLGQIFNEKKKEISNKVKLIESIDEERFSNTSVDLYGKPAIEEVEECINILKNLNIEDLKPEKSPYTAEDAKKRFEKIFNSYGLKSWKVKIKDNMVADCVAGKNNRLFINKGAKFSKERIETLIVHEIETHILTAENGKFQPYEIFNRGLANYLRTQEGMAMYNVEEQRGHSFNKNYKALGHVIAIDLAIKNSFAETYKKLVALGLPSKQAFKSTLKAKRGIGNTSHPGAFTKDYVYYSGYKQVKKFINDGGDIKDLYLGKIDIEDLEKSKSIPGIKNAKILPTWL
ncbi:hypothetical protein COU74_03390 [Candidatus Peregrinibacteria bacterium CG10_big_fil_rev_8_21_14_0_10_36_19]|nr:MAG: hypothetical protein COU74_03390 [Candidatus Peregrinibacteria bacterium CG10_big_fil_rev_8_21_14_0_10_36_19]